MASPSVGDRQNPCHLRNRFAFQTIGISFAVKPLVMSPDARSEVCQSCDVGDDPLAGHRMLLDVEELFGSKRPLLAKDGIANPDLAEVVKQSSEVDITRLATIEAHFFTEPNGDPRDALAMARGIGVLGVDGRRETSHDPEQRFP